MDPIDPPRYRIQAVSQMSGVPAPTLRAWERRYGVPKPDRTDKGYRLYSGAEVELVGKMRALCDAGMSAVDAARMVRQEVQPPDPVMGNPPPATAPELVSEDALATMVTRILDAVDRFDREALQREIRLTLTMGPASQLFDKVFAPVLREVGDRWHLGQISVSQEHLASEALLGALRGMLDLVEPESSKKQALLACFSDEDHSLPLYGVALRLASWGWRPTILGARTPPEALGAAVRLARPALVGLTITVLPPQNRLSATLDAYAQACKGAEWICGGQAAGRIADELQSRGAYVYDGDREKLRHHLARLR